MLQSKVQPFYVRLAFKLLVVVLLAVIIRAEKIVIVPLFFAVLLSILLLPVTKFFERLKFPRSLACLVSVLFAVAVIGSIVWFLSSHLTGFLSDFPSLRERISEHLTTLQNWIQTKFDLSTEQQSSLFNSAKNDLNISPAHLGQTLLTVTQTVLLIVLVAIYTFLILYYRKLIQRVIFALYERTHQDKVQDALQESKVVVQKYMQGLVIEMIIVAIANCAALMIIGVKYAIFLGVFSAVLNIIPYVGIFTGMVFTVLVTIGTPATLHQVVWIIITMEVIHFIDANFLMPRIVGARVKVNALITILGAVTGGALIGIPGVFLALPTIAILKIVFDRMDDMKPWGMLLGDESPPSQLVTRIKRITREKRK